MGRETRAARELVVDLLLVEHCGLPEQRSRDVDKGSAAQERAQVAVDRDEVLAAAQHRAGVGAFEVLEDSAGAVGERGDLLDPAGKRGGLIGLEGIDRDPALLAEVLDQAGALPGRAPEDHDRLR